MRILIDFAFYLRPGHNEKLFGKTCIFSHLIYHLNVIITYLTIMTRTKNYLILFHCTSQVDFTNIALYSTNCTVLHAYRAVTSNTQYRTIIQIGMHFRLLTDCMTHRGERNSFNKRSTIRRVAEKNENTILKGYRHQRQSN